MTEEWRAVVGYEGFYEVSNLGRVRSLDRNDVLSNGVTRFQRGRILSPGHNGSGYYTVQLCKKSCLTHFYVHRLVAFAFLDPPKKDQIEVNHKYGIKSDNRASELEWTSATENVRHAFQVGLKTSPLHTKLTQTDADEIRQLCLEGHTQRNVAHTFGISQALVNQIVSGKTWNKVVI